MSIFDRNTNASPAAALADGFRVEANQHFDTQLDACKDAIARFWYRNTDSDGQPSLDRISGVSDEPTGLEVLTALGTDARTVMTLAHLRVQMILDIQNALGLSIVSESDLAGPYDLTFTTDGALDNATRRD